MEDSFRKTDEYWGIKDVSNKTGLACSTIRYYDQQFEEYLNLKRGPGRRRLFTPKAIKRLLNIHHMLKEEGLSLRQARKVLEEGKNTNGNSELNLQSQVDEMRSELTDLRHQLEELKEIQMRTLSLVGGLTKK